MPLVHTQTGGWLHDQEDHHQLTSTRSPFAYEADLESKLPERVDPTNWMVTHNQGNQGSCQGNALTSAVEACHAVSGGDVVQLSRACGYYMSQRIDDIRGDHGSTISAGVELAMGKGLCLESVWPYPGRYDPTVPQAYERSTKYRVEGHSRISSYAAAIRHIAMHRAIHIGIMWGDDIDRQVSRNGIIEHYRPGGGGHAVFLGGYRPTGFDGQTLREPYILLFNSWSDQWGHKGEALVSPSAINAMINHRWNVFEGLFGAVNPTIEPPTFRSL